MVYAKPSWRADDDDCPRASGGSFGLRWYHCVTRCVRRAFLLGEGAGGRKGWIEHRRHELAEIFAIAVGGFSVMDNHLHVLVRLDPDVAGGWSDEDVGRRSRLFLHRHLQTDIECKMENEKCKMHEGEGLSNTAGRSTIRARLSRAR
jgi:REP element-mobilizing transposase RayT